MDHSGPPPRSSKVVPDTVVGEVQPFDPGPSVGAAARALGTHGIDFALIGGLALDAWGIPRATTDADLAVPVGAAERVAEVLREPTTDIRPLRIGGIGIRDPDRGLRIDLVDRRFHFARLFGEAIEEARARPGARRAWAASRLLSCRSNTCWP